MRRVRTCGKRSTYTHGGCRCTACTEANRVVTQRDRSSRWEKRVLVDGRLFSPIAAKHGDSTYNNYGCRCETCTLDHRRRMNEREQKSALEYKRIVRKMVNDAATGRGPHPTFLNRRGR